MSRTLAVVVLVLVLAGVLGAFGVLATRVAGPEPLSVEMASGQVFRERNGESSEARVGMHLAVGDRVSTGPDGEAVLGRGAYSTVRLGKQTTVSLISVEDGMVELDLERGQVRARVRPDAGAVRLHQGMRSVLATEADFGMAVDEDGTLAIEGERGAVTVSGVGSVAQVEAGQRVVSFPDGSAASWRADPELLLDIAWPGDTPDPSVPLTGRTEPGAWVTVQEPVVPGRVRADAEGQFTVKVPLSASRTAVTLLVTDAFGRQRTARGEIIRDATRPTFDLKIDYERRR